MSNSLVIGTVAFAVGSNEAKKLVSGKGVTVEPVIAGFVLGLFLFSITSLSPNLGTKFCYLIIAAALLTNGIPTLQLLNKLVTGSGPKVSGKLSATVDPTKVSTK